MYLLDVIQWISFFYFLKIWAQNMLVIFINITIFGFWNVAAAAAAAVDDDADNEVIQNALRIYGFES